MCFLLPSAACVQVWLALEPKVSTLAALPGLTISQRPRILRLALGVVAVQFEGRLLLRGPNEVVAGAVARFCLCAAAAAGVWWTRRPCTVCERFDFAAALGSIREDRKRARDDASAG